MKTSELTGADLAMWVARAMGLTVSDGPGERWVSDGGTLLGYLDGYHVPMWAPHEDWAQGGPLIDQYDVQLRVSGAKAFIGEIWTPTERSEKLSLALGPTRLIAATRAIVRSGFGDEVPS